MKVKKYIIIGAILAVCIIAAGVLFISGASTAARLEKQLELANKYLLDLDYEAAIYAFEKAIEIDPKNVDARLGLAKAYVAVGRSDDAIAVLRDAMEINPKRPEPYIQLAEIYIGQGDYSKAVKILEQGLLFVDNVNLSGIQALLDQLKPRAPMASVASGTYEEPITVTFVNIAENDLVYYTMDGTPPNSQSRRYEGGIVLANVRTTLRAIAYRNGIAGEEAIYEYTLNIKPYAVAFEDKVFERAIRKLIGKPEGEVLNTDLLDITNITIIGDEVVDNRRQEFYLYENGYEIDGQQYTKSGQIQTLNDLKWFPNLVALSVNFNVITDISALKELKNLRTLTLYHNQISNISVFKELPNLSYLNLGCNQIRDPSALKALTNLQGLGLNDNQISDISALEGLVKLEWLNLWNNQISDISVVREMKNLESLMLENNAIRDIDALSHLTNLKRLDLSYNQISDIGPLSGLTNLESLYLHANKINDINPLRGLTNLQILNLWNNPINEAQIEALKQALPNTEISN